MDKLGFLIGAALMLLVMAIVAIRHGRHNDRSHHATRLRMSTPTPPPPKPRGKAA